MGGVKREKGVLKLVRPGGIVELHETPITAAQVMEMYPRHCVTRPDVFKYPWIVVRPESVLSIGRVFYIVPRHTIYKLLQKNGLVKGNQTLPKPPQEADDATSYDDVASSRKHHKDRVMNGCQPLMEPSSFWKLARVSPEKISCQKDDEKQRKERLKPKFSDGYIFNETLPNNQIDDLNLKKGDNSMLMIQHKEYDSDDSDDVQSCFPMRRNVSNLEGKKTDSKIKTLKPCLKKHTTKNIRIIKGPRVRFTLPENDQDEKEGVERGA